MSGSAPLAAAVAAAVAARGAYALLRRRPPAGEKTWVRTNHRGELLTLLEGPALPFGAVAGGAVGALAGDNVTRRAQLSAALAALGALGFGVIDDLGGSGQRRGLRGHLGALAHGEVTTGTVKLAGLALTGLGAAWLDAPPGGPPGGAPDRGRPLDIAVNAGLIAGGANLLNLFDLRPGRAIKVALLSAGLIAAGGAVTSRPGAGLAAVAAPAGAALALLPEDLGERAMLGDAGANALGAMLGAAAAQSLTRRARIGVLGGIVALTVASERVSFTRVIQATPPLRWLDMLGRRPPAPAAAVTAAPAPAVRSGTVSGPEAGQETLTETGPAAGDELPRRRPPGRHRRVAARVSHSRSGAWVLAWVKSRARQRP